MTVVVKDAVTDLGTYALTAIHQLQRELRLERTLSRHLAATLATEGKWTTDEWLSQARIAAQEAVDRD